QAGKPAAKPQASAALGIRTSRNFGLIAPGCHEKEQVTATIVYSSPTRSRRAVTCGWNPWRPGAEAKVPAVRENRLLAAGILAADRCTGGRHDEAAEGSTRGAGSRGRSVGCGLTAIRSGARETGKRVW